MLMSTVMDKQELDALRGELEQAIKTGDIVNATPEQLQRWLISVCTGYIPNHMVHPREIVRGITINHIQMAQTIRQLEDTIERLNTENKRTQWLVILLAVITLSVGIVQVIVSVLALLETV